MKSTASTRKWPLPIAGSSTLRSKSRSTRSLCVLYVFSTAKRRIASLSFRLTPGGG